MTDLIPEQNNISGVLDIFLNHKSAKNRDKTIISCGLAKFIFLCYSFF
jgi:hypothetical protein